MERDLAAVSVELFVYCVAIGVFAAGLAFHALVIRVFNARDYASLALLDLVAIAFCATGAGGAGAALVGAAPPRLFDWAVAKELVALAFTPVIPLFLASFIKGSPGLRRFHRILAAFGSGLFVLILSIVLFGEPGQFLHPAAGGDARGGYGSGPYHDAGFLVLGAILLESCIILLVDSFIGRSFGKDPTILIGSLLASWASISAIAKDMTGRYLDPFPGVDFPRAAAALLLYGLFASLGFYAHFLRQARGVQDASRELERSRSRLAELLDRDELTGLPNRGAFSRDLGGLFEGAMGDGRGVAVLLFDLMGFMALNQSYGSQVADGILAAVPAILASILPRGSRLYRMSGDEFALIMPDGRALDRGGSTREAATGNAAQAIRERLLKGVPSGGERYALDAAFAVAVLPEDGASPAEAVANAYSALSEAKEAGRGIVRYSAEHHREAMRRVATVAELREDIRAGEFRLEYQPIVDWTGALLAAEALLRWTGGKEGPGYFVPLLESAGLMREMGGLITRLLVRDLGKELITGRVPSLTVNLSALQIEDVEAFSELRADFESAGIPLHRLQFEVTESIFLDRKSGNIGRLASLRQAGAKVAIDDFGTGYSNLGYLRTLPVDKIKLDRSFLAMAPGNRSAEVLIKAVADVGRSFRLGLVSEGVETEEQFHFLKRAGYEEFQGFLFAKPLGKEELLRFIDRGGWRKGRGKPDAGKR